ncbi:hypothetical protein [Peredibacter starrii]|uniref:Uncharacterized protein n=1 Tax=Peredibacter starrii TaxID=28202 RepID=A0AAX4HSB0_9BACT|nr:hypothetical protein [Peredibacter starrii]WPU66250.1 hypothetical protein SOO65_05775 [Peredibacter starrii]
MKSLILLSLLAISTSAFSYYNPFEGVPAEICPGMKVDQRKVMAVCDHFRAERVLSARVGRPLSPQELKLNRSKLLSPSELGIIPDADTTVLFSYVRYVLNDRNLEVGMITIDGWKNNETGEVGRVDTRYTNQGQVISIQLLPLR